VRIHESDASSDLLDSLQRAREPPLPAPSPSGGGGRFARSMEAARAMIPGAPQLGGDRPSRWRAPCGHRPRTAPTRAVASSGARTSGAKGSRCRARFVGWRASGGALTVGLDEPCVRQDPASRALLPESGARMARRDTARRGQPTPRPHARREGSSADGAASYRRRWTRSDRSRDVLGGAGPSTQFLPTPSGPATPQRPGSRVVRGFTRRVCCA